MHTVASSFASISDDDAEQVDPFMFGNSPRTIAFPGSAPTTPPEDHDAGDYLDMGLQRSPVRPIIHIRTRSWGVHQMASPAPKTPLPPVPDQRQVEVDPSSTSMLARNTLATPTRELSTPSFSFPRPAMATTSSSRLVKLSEIAEEDRSVSGSSVMLRSSFDTDRAASQSGSSGIGNQLDSFINFDHSSIGSDPDSSTNGEEEEHLSDLPAQSGRNSKFGLRLVMPSNQRPSTFSPQSPETPSRRKLSKLHSIKHKRSNSEVEPVRMPSFVRGSSSGSVSSQEDLITPKDIPDQPHSLRTHKRSSSWTRFKDRLKGLGGD